jgi:protein-arginine kinase activator protein McsA
MNYERKVMESAFRILNKKNFKWGHEFDNKMKTDLLNMLLTYFTDIEQYEKCAHIHSMIKDLENMNENISKTNFTGSGIS